MDMVNHAGLLPTEGFHESQFNEIRKVNASGLFNEPKSPHEAPNLPVIPKIRGSNPGRDKLACFDRGIVR